MQGSNLIVRTAQDCSRERSRETVVRFVSPTILSGPVARADLLLTASMDERVTS
jgi:hypothetical protein